ncbi:MAG: lipopolysaccharide export system protein LptC [Paracoccaceae bacterium]
MDGYSRMVAIFKVILPLAALALLSTVFMLSRNLNPTAIIPFAENEIAERLRDKQITSPVYSGTTSDGDEISVTARQASPGGLGTPATARDLHASIVSPDGLRITLNSETGTLGLAENRATFGGSVKIETNTGYVLETDLLNTSLNSIDANTPGQVTGDGPIGQLTAGNMTIRSEINDGSVHMLFNGGVKLIYTPKQLER